MTTAQRTDEFERLRSHLLAVAYRLTGTFADAEDAVQDAWLRWHALGPDRDGIADLRAWLTTVVSRIGLDRLRVGGAPPRGLLRGVACPNPWSRRSTGLIRSPPSSPDEDARFAAMVVLERLTPDQRVAFVLHDGFAVPFGEIADVLGVSRRPPPARVKGQADRRRRRGAAAGSVARRGRRQAHGGHGSRRHGGRRRAAASRRDVHRRLEPQGAHRRPRHPRSDKVARFVFGLAARYGPKFFEAAQLALVNGELGVYNEGFEADGEWPAMQPHIQALTVRDGKVYAIWDIANPDKFTGSPLGN